MFHSCVLFICNLSISLCSHRCSRETMDHYQKGSIVLSWCARAIQILICLLTHNHVCLTQFRPHPSVTSTEAKSYLHTPTVALKLHSKPHLRLPVCRPSRSSLPSLSYTPCTLISKCLKHLLTTFSFQANLQKDIVNICLRFHCNIHVSVAL